MDDADLAAIVEANDRKAALLAVLSRPDRDTEEMQQYSDKGQIICIDCKDLIDPLRLKARPDAVRCVFCKANWEKRKQSCQI